MTKKKYIHPKAKVLQIKLESLLQEGSPGSLEYDKKNNGGETIDEMDGVL